MKVLSAIVAVLIAALFVGCAKERALTPREQHSRVYVTALITPNLPPMLFVFDGEADSLVDSLAQPLEWGDFQIVCDPDQPRYATTQFSNTRVYRGSNPLPYFDDTLPTVYHAFDSKRELLIGTSGGHGTVAAPVFRLYDPSNLSVLFSDTFGLAVVRLDRRRGLAFGVTVYQDVPGGASYRTELCAYDYVNHRPHRCWNILPDSTGRGYDIGRFALHPDGRRVYLTGGKSHLFCYDLIDDRVLFDAPVYGPFGEPAVSPDGNEVWYPEVGLNRSTDPGTITIYDAHSGAVKSVIDLNEYRIRPLKPIRPYQIRFTLSGQKAYVVCHGDAGPVLAIDMKSHEVRKSFYFRTGEVPERFISRIDIGPAP